MENDPYPMFPEETLAVLDRLAHDPRAKPSYDIFSGGLRWPDEFPSFGPGHLPFAQIGLVRAVIAYRASLTLGEERVEYRPLWQQVASRCPNWPGLRPDRRDRRMRRRLIAAKRREARCLEELERELGLGET